jgi:hypothetical protein
VSQVAEIAEPAASQTSAKRWSDQSFDGFWTYTIVDTNRGGVLMIKCGVVVGGNSLLYFRGIVLPIGDGRISMTTHVHRFNHDPSWDRVWGADADFYLLTFEGRWNGEHFVGTVTRHDIQDRFQLILTRQGPGVS